MKQRERGGEARSCFHPARAIPLVALSPLTVHAINRKSQPHPCRARKVDADVSWDSRPAVRIPALSRSTGFGRYLRFRRAFSPAESSFPVPIRSALPPGTGSRHLVSVHPIELEPGAQRGST